MTSEVWLADETDIQGMIEMGRRFHAAQRLPGVFSPGAFGGFCAHLIGSDDGAVFRTAQGMIGGFIQALPWDATYRVADEAFWWAEDGSGGKLLTAYEAWATANADEVRMGCMTSGRWTAIARVLGRRGYEISEIGVVKRW